MSPATEPRTIRVQLPSHLRTLAGVPGEVVVETADPSVQGVMEALEVLHPVLRGTIRNHEDGVRRDYMRYFACGEDISHDPVDTILPDPVLRGKEPLRVVGAISGG